MKQIELKQIREKMKKAIETEFRGWGHPDKTRCPSLKKMAEYINCVFPSLEAKIISWSQHKGRQLPSGVYYTRKLYVGNKLVVVERDEGRTIFEHDSTETYRVNTDVAEFILKQLKILQRETENEKAH